MVAGAKVVDPGTGNVASVTAGDATITIGGTSTAPTVKVTAGTFDGYGAANAAANNAVTEANIFATGAVGVETTRAEAAEALLAPLASPALTGNPTAPTQTAGDNSTKIATTAYADKYKQRSSTITIACSNSSAAGKAAADYVLTGTNDEITIANAIHALPAGSATHVGRIVILDGYVQINSPIYLDCSYVTLEGQGPATVIIPNGGATGYAAIIAGSNSLDGVNYQNGDSAPASSPTRVIIKNLNVGWGNGTTTTVWNHGIVMRSNQGIIDNVVVSNTGLDGIRHESFMVCGTANTITAGGTTTPTWGTSESWTAGANGPSATFYAIVNDGTYDPEIVYVSAGGTGTAWTVRRGVMDSTIKAHTPTFNITPITRTAIYLCRTVNCLVYQSGLATSPNIRRCYFSTSLVSDSEWLFCIANCGSSNAASDVTTNSGYGFQMGSSNCRFIDCHPYFARYWGFHGGSYDPNYVANIHIIIGGEFETCGYGNSGGGIYFYINDHSSVSNAQFFANATYDLTASSCNELTVEGNEFYSPNYRGVNLNSCTNFDVAGNKFVGNNSGSRIYVSGTSASTLVNGIVRHNIVNGVTTLNSIEVSDIAGVRIIENTCIGQLAETNSQSATNPDYIEWIDNSLTTTAKGITIVGAHSVALGNYNIVDGNYRPIGYGLRTAEDFTTAVNTSTTLSTTAATLVTTGVAGIPATSGVLYLLHSGTYYAVSYTGVSGNSLTGCTIPSGSVTVSVSDPISTYQAKQGTVTLVSGAATVHNVNVTATSRIFLTAQSLGTVTAPQALAVTARTAGTSFTITSANSTDTSVIAYEIFEVG